jgi:3-dehydroquinate synthase
MKELLSLSKKHRYAIITDKNLEKIYGKNILQKMREAGFKADLISFKAEEKYKNQKTKTWIEEKMLKMGFDRNSKIIALGGGIVGDIAGFVAATFMRGIPYIQVPTTLLAMSDSSIGGKVGINAKFGKNLIGATWMPEKIILDFDFLKTLGDEQMKIGLAEVFKIFLTHDKKNLPKILSYKKNLEFLIKRAATLKSIVIKKDPYEKNERYLLNFGHSIGHALEILSNYKLRHGEAVYLGIIVEAKIAELLGNMPKNDYATLANYFKKLDIDITRLKKFKIKDILETLKYDKKNLDGKIRMVILEGIGKAKLKTVEPRTIKEALEIFI